MQKFISFRNAEDLLQKAKLLEEITSQNIAEIKEFLLIKNIPYQELEDGICVDTGDTSEEIFKEYMETFSEMNGVTLEKFKALGVVYITKPSVLETDIALSIKFNLKTREN